jgi:RNase P subunit RPR2
MERTYCDRCGQLIDRADKILKSWVAFYDRRTDEYYNYSYGSFKQTVCEPCLDDLIPVFNEKVVKEPAEAQYSVQLIVKPEPCKDCWLCRLKRRFGGKK